MLVVIKLATLHSSCQVPKFPTIRYDAFWKELEYVKQLYSHGCTRLVNLELISYGIKVECLTFKDPPTIEKCQHLSNQLLYTRLASIPSRYDAFWKELEYVKQLVKTRHEFKTEDMGIAALFGLECFAWYCAGEIVGRGFTITGYYA
ncbi:unnamed protein product [Lactuca saligna]|uniref:Mitochondrial ATP synthase subunit G protein n=1 Tax=Lactuca saligna TaxID=75948 RepID=A0AA35ZC93_LACSI|nr:unnamed protein product [Lactuca saligna]